MNGLITGTSDGGGSVNAAVSASGLLLNGTNTLNAQLAGNANGTGSSRLVGASNLASNTSGVQQGNDMCLENDN
jgi:hypothetical protein